MKRTLILFVFLVSNTLSVTTFCAPSIYKTVDEKGVVTYSDQPDATAEAVVLEKENVSKRPVAPNLKAGNGAATDAAEQRQEYTDFSISSPKDQDTFQNATEIPVSVSLSPALQKGDTIEFYFDGTPVNKASTETSITIPKVFNDKELITRGSHTLSASIIDANGEKIKTTASITVFVHYASVNQPLRK